MATVLELDKPATSSGGYKIDRGVPVPPGRGCAGSPRFPLGALEIGDSFYVPFGSDPMKTRSVLSNAVAAFHLRHKPKRFVTRKDGGGIRVWRTA
jgi:hypothetical protein